VLPNAVIERFDSTTLKEGERDASTESRFEFWGVAWDIYKRNPIAGSGYHTFHHKELNPYGMDAHNFFMRELTEKGIVGLAIVLVLLLKVYRAIRRTMREHPPGSFAHGLALGMTGAFVALVAGSCFGDRFTYYPMVAYFWAYVGLILVATRLPEGSAQDAH
jgi:putative inorganic carbon (hco3(-)) transporter